VVFVRHGVVIFDAVAEKKLRTLFRSLPPGGYGASRRFAVAESSELFVGLVKNIALLLERHIGGVFVRVAVEANFVACVSYSSAVFGEGFERMTRLQTVRFVEGNFRRI
jgi:hypothetical protein